MNVADQLNNNRLFMEEYDKYNESIGNALRLLPEQKHEITGREMEIKLLNAVLERPLTPVALLLGQAGVGKTALVEEYVKRLNNNNLPNTGYDYCLFALRVGQLASIGLEKLQSELSLILDHVKDLEAKANQLLGRDNIRFILFIDEVHMLVTIFGPGTKIGGDVMKDILARTPIRVIGATTKIEYDSTIAVDKPLSERFKVIELQELPTKTIEKIAMNWWKKHAPTKQMLPINIIKKIISANKIYRSDSAEPRKTLDILEDCVSYFKRNNKMIDDEGVNNIFKQRYSINLAFEVRGDDVYNSLADNIYGQPHALYTLKRLLRQATFKVDLQSNKPIFTALFCGSTGVGKGLLLDDYTPTINGFVKNRHIKEGDIVFDRLGNLTTIEGAYPQGFVQTYEIEFSDSRKIICDENHLWGYYTNKQKIKFDLGEYKTQPTFNVSSTKELFEKGWAYPKSGGRVGLKYYIPMNHAVKYPERKYTLDPYIMGALIADGSLTLNPLTISNNDEFVLNKISGLLPNKNKWVKLHDKNFNYNFLLNGEDVVNPKAKYLQVRHFEELSELFGTKSNERFIPDAYKMGSVKQRWSLIQGLFDTDGHISKSDRFGVTYTSTSERLINDIREVLYSLGVSTTTPLQRYADNRDKNTQYTFSVRTRDLEKTRFFTLPRKLEIAEKAASLEGRKSRMKKYNFIGIKNIKKLGVQETVCFKVDNDESLFQTGKNYIVTHNTASAKIISETLYPSEKVLVNINMPDFKLPEHDDAFRKKLGETIRHKPNSIILLDELEKADQSILDSLLAILDEGIVNFIVKNREGADEMHFVSLRNTIVIATSNAGHEVFQDDARFSQRGVDKDAVNNITKAEIEQLNNSLREHLLKAGFRPELLGRFNQIVAYRGLDRKSMIKIAEKYVYELVEGFRINYGINFEIPEKREWGDPYRDYFTHEIALYLVESKTNMEDTRSGGARAIQRAVDDHLYSSMIDAVIDYQDENIKDFRIEVSRDTKIFDSGLAHTDGGIYVIPIEK